MGLGTYVVVFDTMKLWLVCGVLAALTTSTYAEPDRLTSLIARLGHGSAEERRAACFTLYSIRHHVHRHPAAVLALIEHGLSSPDEFTRAHAAQTLGYSRSSDAVQGLLRTARKGCVFDETGHPGVSAQAVLALGRLGKRAASAVDTLGDLAKGGVPTIRVAAAKAVFQIDRGPIPARTVLSEIVGRAIEPRADTVELQNAAFALSELGTIGPTVASVAPRVRSVIALRNVKVRALAAAALLAMEASDSRTLEVVRDLLGRVGSDDCAIMLHALRRVGHRVGPVAPSVVRLFKNRSVSKFAVSVIGSMGKNGRAYLQEVITVLGNGSVEARANAAVACWRIAADPELILPTMKELLTTRSLGRHGGHLAAQTVLDLVVEMGPTAAAMRGSVQRLLDSDAVLFVSCMPEIALASIKE